MNSKSFFLTYPRTDVSKNDLLQFLRTKGTIVEYVIGREAHADGTPHLHAAIKYDKAIRGTTRMFDFRINADEVRHPNIQSPRRFQACKSYCKKDGDFIEDKEDQDIIILDEEESLSEICKRYNTYLEWLEYCIKEKISFQYAQAFWNDIHLDVVTIRPDDNILGEIREPLSSYRWNHDQYPVISIIGPSGIGKTTWARTQAIKPALFISHIDQLKLFKAGYHKTIIFDDMNISHWPRESQIHLLDWDNPRAIHLRHIVATIPRGIYKIFTSNNDILNLSDPAINRRIRTVRINQNTLFQ